MEKMLISPPQKCMGCTLMKMLTFMDGPLLMYSVENKYFSATVLSMKETNYYSEVYSRFYHVLIRKHVFGQ